MVSPRASAAWTSACRALVRSIERPAGAVETPRPGRVRFGLRWLFLQAGAVPGNPALDSLGQVVPQMPAIRDLGGQRRALGSAFRVAPAAVPADHLHARMSVQPGTERLRRPLREHVHRPAGLDVDQHGAVDMPLAQGEIIDTQNVRGAAARIGRGADEPQQRGAAR